MSVVQLSLTAEQLADAYAQLNAKERRSFLKAIFNRPSQQQAALELLIEAKAILKQKFSPQEQNLLNKLLDKSAEGKLRPSEREKLDELMGEYGAGLIEKARAKYILHLAEQSETTNR